MIIEILNIQSLKFKNNKFYAHILIFIAIQIQKIDYNFKINIQL